MRFALAALTMLLLAAPASALSIGQADTFEDGTTQGWVVNLLGMGAHPAPPTNVASGGPLGADDNFLMLTAVGGGAAGNRLTVVNSAQWAGDYTTTGIASIALDLRNFGTTDLNIRLYLEDPTIGPPANTAVTSSAVFLPSGGGWTHVEFAIDAASLTGLLGDVDALLSNVTVLRIVHSPLAEFPGPALVAQLGVDNVTALPEPALAALLVAGLGAGAFARRP